MVRIFYVKHEVLSVDIESKNHNPKERKNKITFEPNHFIARLQGIKIEIRLKHINEVHFNVCHSQNSIYGESPR